MDHYIALTAKAMVWQSPPQSAVRPSYNGALGVVDDERRVGRDALITGGRRSDLHQFTQRLDACPVIGIKKKALLLSSRSSSLHSALIIFAVIEARNVNLVGFLQFVIREPHQRAIALATRGRRPRATLLIDRDAAGLPRVRVAQLVRPALNLTLKKQRRRPCQQAPLARGSDAHHQ